MSVGTDAERLECGKNDEDGGPSVVKGEGKVNEKLVRHTSGLVVLFDDVIDMGYGRTDEERKYEGYGESGKARKKLGTMGRTNRRCSGGWPKG